VWGTEDRRPATVWSWPGGGGPRPALLFFSFFCAVSIWVAHDKERVTPSRWGWPSSPFLCRVSHFAHDKGLYRALPFPTAHDKGLCRTKMRHAPFVVRPGRIRTAKAVPCGFWPLPCACQCGNVPNQANKLPAHRIDLLICHSKQIEMTTTARTH
jgi:hypothetical protein